MSESAKVRLVRCPKCENLLPELADYSVYQCGGCGAVLRAKNKNFEGDVMSQKSDEEMVQGVSGKSDNFNFPEKVMNLSDGSENDVKSNGSCSSRRSDRRVVLGNIVDNQSSGLSIKADKWAVNNELVLNENLDELGRVEMGEEFEESKPPNGIANGSQISRGVAEIGEGFEGLKPPNGIANGSRRSSRVADWRSGEGDDSEGFWRNPRKDAEGMRYSASKYLEDGPSNYHMRSTSDYGEPAKNQNKYDEFNKVEYLEQDRAELLRKLDELKDQINRSCDVHDKAKEKVPFDRGLVPQEEPYAGSETWFPDGSRGTRASIRYMPDMHVARPYVSHYPEASLHMNRHQMDMQRFYPPNQVQRFGDPLRSQMLRRAPQQGPVPLQQQAAYPYYSRKYVENDPFETHPPHMNFHQPSCSCVRCYNKHTQVSASVPPAAFHGKTFSDIPNKSMFYHHENRRAFGPRDYNPEIANPRLLNPHYPQSHTRWPSDLNSEVGGFVRRYPPRVVLATGGQRCRPIAGGAPFVTCNNCFQLLQLPKKILLMEKNQKKVRCGACSTVILFAVVNNKLVISVHSETKRTLNMVDDSPSTTADDGTLHSHVHANQASMNFSSDDYDNSGYDFQAMDREMISSSTGKSAEMRSLQSTSLYSSDDGDSPESLNARGEESNSAELAAKANPSPPLAGSPLQEHFDYSTIYNRSGKGNQSGRSERGEELKKATLRQNSMKDSSLPTEMEVSFNEYSHTGTSQESGNGSREEDQLRVTKGGQSFFASIIKKSFKDLSKSNQTIEQSTINVKINGHPIPDRLLKKAEKLAGPIHPGQYWYDFRAGFWGVMGGPCLGIVPPFIEEFNYPMPENCAGGDTGIFVNGRELHQKDLRLLNSRGLPTTKDRSYIIEISGRVLDEDSGEELDGLGKLAPTIEKVKHGFGMKVPRVAK